MSYTVLPDKLAQIKSEKIKVLYRHLPPLLTVNGLVSLALVYGIWASVNAGLLLVWLFCMLLMIVWRGATYLRYKQSTGHSDTTVEAKWGTQFTAGSAMAGVLWGAAGVLFYTPSDLTSQFFVLFILMGMGAGSMASLTIHLPAFYLFFPTMMLPIGVVLLTQDEPIMVALGLCAFLYVGGLSYFARTLNRSLVESLSLRFENIDLVKKYKVQKEEAEMANIAKSKFLAAASHDLRQPLHALTLLHSVLQDRIDDDQSRKIMRQINVSTAAMESLFDTLLDISRLEAGALVPSINHFELQDIIDKLHNDYVMESAKRGLSYVCEPCDVVLKTDPVLLEQILRNYLTNAFRYTHKGEIKLHCEPVVNGVNIHVTDTGIGIAKQQQVEIFREFHQINNVERDRSKGMGLGLAIVHRVAHLLHHPIFVESNVGAGSTFSITVPLGEKDQVDAKVHSVLAEPDTCDPDIAIALVDDDVQVRESMQALFEFWGCKLFSAASANDVLSQVTAENKTLHGIIADYRLSEYNTGVDAIRCIREALGQNIPAVIVTGDTEAEKQPDVQESGLQLLHKPVAPAKLRTFLRRAENNARKKG